MPNQESVSLEELTVTIRGRTLVEAASLRLHAGELVALLGPNGAGKTSLLRAMLGLIEPSSGRILVHGKPLERLSTLERARTLAYVPQSSHLDTDLCVRDVVAMGRYAHRGEFAGLGPRDEAMIREVCAQTDVTHLLERAVRTLSGGERSRVLVARALATEAPIVLLDEPTTSLDVRHALRCLQHLRTLAERGKSLLLVTHDLQHAYEYADRVILMHEARIIAEGAAHEVLTSSRCRRTFGVELVPQGALGYRCVKDDRA